MAQPVAWVNASKQPATSSDKGRTFSSDERFLNGAEDERCSIRHGHSIPESYFAYRVMVFRSRRFLGSSKPPPEAKMRGRDIGTLPPFPIRKALPDEKV